MSTSTRTRHFDKYKAMRMINKIFALPIIKQITPTLSLRQYDQLEIIVIAHPKLQAAIALQGAHLLSWQPQGEKQVLWLSDNTDFHKGIALRGGVPICWPWFGPATDTSLPSHGFARNLPWTLHHYQEDSDGIDLIFELKSNKETLNIWPHVFTLYAHFRLADTCEITLESHGDFETTSALHSYFAVGDIDQVTVTGLGENYIDKVLSGITGTLTDGKQTFADRTDRIYLTPENCSIIHDPSLHRTIHVDHHHNQNVVAWNPGVALSVSMADMPNDGYKTFLCVETACVTATQIVMAEKPGRLGQSIRLVKKNG